MADRQTDRATPQLSVRDKVRDAGLQPGTIVGQIARRRVSKRGGYISERDRNILIWQTLGVSDGIIGKQIKPYLARANLSKSGTELGLSFGTYADLHNSGC